MNVCGGWGHSSGRGAKYGRATRALRDGLMGPVSVTQKHLLQDSSNKCEQINGRTDADRAWMGMKRQTEKSGDEMIESRQTN